MPRLRGVSLVAATDVDSPLTGLHGASAVFGPQKGASRADVLLLDAALERFAEVLERDLPGCPPGLAALPGAGAAGGLGAALLACGARRESGIGLVRRLTGLDAALAESDLVITGEGSFDEQSLRGKVVGGVAARRAGPGRAVRRPGRPGRAPVGVARSPPGSPSRIRWWSTSAPRRTRWPDRPRGCAPSRPGWPGSGAGHG